MVWCEINPRRWGHRLGFWWYHQAYASASDFPHLFAPADAHLVPLAASW